MKSEFEVGWAGWKHQQKLKKAEAEKKGIKLPEPEPDGPPTVRPKNAVTVATREEARWWHPYGDGDDE